MRLPLQLNTLHKRNNNTKHNSDALDQPLPVAAAANEAYKQAKRLGLGDADFSAVFEATQQQQGGANAAAAGAPAP